MSDSGQGTAAGPSLPTTGSVTLVWTPGSGYPSVSGSVGHDGPTVQPEPAAVIVLRRFAQQLRRFPELDTVTDGSLVQAGPGGPDEGPRTLATVEVGFLPDGQNVAVSPLSGYRRSDMADMAADNLEEILRRLDSSRRISPGG